ncbi:MAG TPA: tetratricopeptide repeat protein, partial [Geobacteraceae bacterium]
TALIADKRPDEAFYHVGEALRIKPDYASAYNNLGVLYNRRGDIAQTSAAYDKALEIDPALSETRFNLGLVYLTSGEKEKALRQYRILERFNRVQATNLLKFIEYVDSRR